MRPVLALGGANQPVGIATGRFHAAGVELDNDFLDQWRALGEQAGDPNVFFESWMMGAALARLAPDSGPVGLFAAHDQMGRLSGLVPLIRHRAALKRYWSVWSHNHCFDNTPLVRSGQCEVFLQALFDWLERRGAAVVMWPTLASDTVFADHLVRFLDATGRCRLELRRTARPLLRADELSVAEYCGSSLSRSRRRGAERRRRRLSQSGRLAWRQFQPDDDVADWCRRFLELEAGGWKGQLGTAMQSRPAEKAYFEALAAGGARLGRIMASSLELDGRPIAMTFNFRNGSRIWAFKSAYDEAMRAFAPGVLAEIEDARMAIEDPAINWVDSCTHAENKLMNELWPHRRPIVDLMVAVRPGARRDLALFGAGHYSLLAVRAIGRRLVGAANWAGSSFVGREHRRGRKK